MSGKKRRASLVNVWYQQYLSDQDLDQFGRRVQQRYGLAALERLVIGGNRSTRRAAVLALGLVGDYSSNETLGNALRDRDRGVRMLADGALRTIWSRQGTSAEQRGVQRLIQMNQATQFDAACRLADKMLQHSPILAEVWNQRAVAHYGCGRFEESIRDCQRVLELNPYHFGAAAGMGQCHLKMGHHQFALKCFEHALQLNPDLEGVRASAVYLRRMLKQR